MFEYASVLVVTQGWCHAKLLPFQPTFRVHTITIPPNNNLECYSKSRMYICVTRSGACSKQSAPSFIMSLPKEWNSTLVGFEGDSTLVGFEGDSTLVGFEEDSALVWV